MSDATSARGTGAALPARARVVIVGGGSLLQHRLPPGSCGSTDIVLLEPTGYRQLPGMHGLITSAGMTRDGAVLDRYSRELYARRESETGRSTSCRQVGHLSLATSKERQAALRREAAWMHGFASKTQISPSSSPACRRWPRPTTCCPRYSNQRGRADPVGVAHSLAKGARQLGASVMRASPRPRARAPRRITAVLTERAKSRPRSWSTRPECGRAGSDRCAGVHVPLQAADTTTC